MKAMKMKKKASARTIETYAVCGCVYAMCSCTAVVCDCGRTKTFRAGQTSTVLSSNMTGSVVNGTA